MYKKDFAFQVNCDILVLMSQNLHSPNLFKMDYPVSCSCYLKLFIGFLYVVSSLWMASLLTYYQENK